jgi:uncharacterized protein
MMRLNKKMWQKLGVAAFAGGTTGSLLSLAGARYLVTQLVRCRPPELSERFTVTPYELGIEYEDVQFPTVNERLLHGWWLPRPETNRVVIAVSGYRGKKEDVLGISGTLWRNGYNVLLFDYRAHGTTRLEDELLTLGHRELEDMQAAIAYVRQRVPNVLLGLMGGSMGASVSIVAAARDPEVKAVWADSAFTSQERVISHAWKSITKLPSTPIVPLAGELFARQTGYRWQDFEPLAEIPKLGRRPVYIIHGGSDRTTPVDCAYELYEAAPGPKSLWVAADAQHCQVYFLFRETYSQRALKFFGRYLTETATDLLDRRTAKSLKLLRNR